MIVFSIEMVAVRREEDNGCPAPMYIPNVKPRAKPFSDFIGLFWDSNGAFQSRNVVFTYMKYLIPRGWDFHMFVTNKSLAFYRRNETFVELEKKKCLTYSVIPPFNRDSFVFSVFSQLRENTHSNTQQQMDENAVGGIDLGAGPGRDDSFLPI